MAAPIVDAITTVPNRGNATNQASFSNDVDTFFSEVDGFQTQINALGEFVNDKAIQADTDATNAATSALEAEDSALVAVGAANYKGKWEGKTSAGTIGESYSYAGSDIYALNVNLANLSTSVPSTTNTDWQLINALDFTPDATPLIDLEFDSETYTVYDGFGAGFAQKPLADITNHTRSTSGTGIAGNLSLATASANVPRIVFDPETGERLGYLAEEQRDNLAKNSNSFSGGFNTTVIASAVNDPRGSLTASLCVPNAVNEVHYAGDRAVSVVAGETYSFSVYVRDFEDSGYYLIMRTVPLLDLLNDNTFWIDLADGSFQQGGGGSVEKLKDGWLRCTMTYTATTTGDTIFRCHISNSTALTPFQGDGERGILLYMRDLEEGAFPTSTIETAGTIVSRTRDSMSRTLTGNELNRSAFSLFWHGYFPVGFATGSATNSVIAGLTDGTYANGICISGQASSSNIRFHARSSSSDVALTRIIESTSGEYKILFSIDRSTSTLSVFVNGAKIAVPSGSIFSALDFNTLTTMELVKGWLGNNFGSATTKNLRLFNNSFSDTDGKKVTRL